MKLFKTVFLALALLAARPAAAQYARETQNEDLPVATATGPSGESFHLPPSAAPPAGTQPRNVTVHPAVPQNVVPPADTAAPTVAAEAAPPPEALPNSVNTARPAPPTGSAQPAPPSVTNAEPGSSYTAAATPVPMATPLPAPTPMPTIAPTPVPAVQQTERGHNIDSEPGPATPADRTLTDETSSKGVAAARTDPPSPLWKVGGVVLTLLGLLALVVLTPAFAPLSRPQQALAWSAIGTAGVAQIADTFAGLSGAASPAQCLLTLAGFGGIAASGILDNHRNRAAAGVLWLSASAMVTHSLSHGSDSAGAVSGSLAVVAGLCAIALCATAFANPSPASEADDNINAAAAAVLSGATVIPRPAPNAAAARAATVPAAAPLSTARQPVRTAGRQPDKGVARLIGVEGALKGRVITLMEGNNTAGSDAAALDGHKIHLAGDDKVSRLHAILTCTGGRCTVADMKSANGVYLNGGQVLDERDLMNGDRLQIGGTVFLYQRI